MTGRAESSGDGAGFRRLAMAPGLVLGVGLVAMPLALVVGLSVRVNDGSLFGSGLTAANFATVTTDPLYALVIARSLVIAALVTAATVLTAYPVAYYLSFHAGRRRAVLLFLVTLPFWTSYLCASSPGRSCSPTTACSTPR